MIRRTFRSAPVIGRVQECVAMFRRAIGGEAEAHAKAKSESAQGQNRGNRNRKKDFEAELAAAKLKYGPCGVCGKEKDHRLADCPYKKHIPNPLEVTVLDGRYGIICKCCGQPGGHPGCRGWTGRATLKFCSHCIVWGEHWTADCPCVEPDEVEKLRKDIKEDECYCLREEPEKEEFLDVEPYFRAVQGKDEENEYDA